MIIRVRTATGTAGIAIDEIAAVVLAEDDRYGCHTEIHMKSNTIFSALSYLPSKGKPQLGVQAHESILKDLGWGV